MLRMRLNRDERGLVVAEERETERVRYNINTKGPCAITLISHKVTSSSCLCRHVLTGSTKNVHVDLLQQTHHKSIDLR